MQLVALFVKLTSCRSLIAVSMGEFLTARQHPSRQRKAAVTPGSLANDPDVSVATSVSPCDVIFAYGRNALNMTLTSC
jgi:hypothetical protein